MRSALKGVIESIKGVAFTRVLGDGEETEQKQV